ncbi:11213_t:CDS:2 [Cetraspora pellucida]|uniref:11213_t:CDS:1 n=1 Tax=Cetraspora pellucida TaxID=1433469 RepID=A0ACA9LHX2_9GLOM|nr:11213_t:CDS:2 [Cetraspora pellucida]
MNHYQQTNSPISRSNSPLNRTNVTTRSASPKSSASSTTRRRGESKKDDGWEDEWSNLTELALPDTMQMSFPDESDLLNFNLSITPDEGFYRGGVFKFTFNINNNYPHDPPKIYHPNIDLEGNVCLNILREDWKPVLNLNSVLVGLQYLFLEPNPEDPLNKEAAEEMRNNRKNFEYNVKQSMRGKDVKGVYFENVLS